MEEVLQGIVVKASKTLGYEMDGLGCLMKIDRNGIEKKPRKLDI